MHELDKIIETGEKIFWEGKPMFWPFFLSSLVGIWFGLLFLIAGAVVFYTGYTEGGSPLIFLFPHFWIGLAIVFGPPIYKFLVYKYTYYAITNKRVLIQAGVIGRDFQITDFDQITNAVVNVGLLDILFGRRSGSILISTAGTFTEVRGRYGSQILAAPYTLSNVPNPYEIFKLFKKVSHDVKTDIHYPNKYRPTTNPGYQTGYNPSK
jgi:membrane protein YdbS with pleckstrin-like domain